MELGSKTGKKSTPTMDNPKGISFGERTGVDKRMLHAILSTFSIKSNSPLVKSLQVEGEIELYIPRKRDKEGSSIVVIEQG